MNNYDFSLVMASYKRPHLLRLGLSSLVKYKPNLNFEVIVVNDGIEDDTEKVCDDFIQRGLDIKYIFSGQRNLDGVMKHRIPGFALNIGFKASKSDILILTCPEVYHFNNILTKIVDGLRNNPNTMAVAQWLHFDLTGELTKQLISLSDGELIKTNIDIKKLSGGDSGDGWEGHYIMPYCMGIFKNHVIEAHGYAEDMTGFAGDDSDFCKRMQMKGLKYLPIEGRVVHLWHEGTGDGRTHYENPQWVYNYNLFINRKHWLVNTDKEWGVIQ